MVDDPQPHLEQTTQRLREQADLVRTLLDEHGDTDEAVTAFVAEVDRRTREAAGAETASGVRGRSAGGAAVAGTAALLAEACGGPRR